VIVVIVASALVALNEVKASSSTPINFYSF